MRIAWALSAQLATRSISVSGMRSRYFPSAPGPACATVTINSSAGMTGVPVSAAAYARTSPCSRASIESGAIWPRMPMRLDIGLP